MFNYIRLRICSEQRRNKETWTFDARCPSREPTLSHQMSQVRKKSWPDRDSNPGPLAIRETTELFSQWSSFDNNRCLFNRLPGKWAPAQSAVWWIVGNSPGSRANNIYSPGNDKLTEVQLYKSTSCQPGSRVIWAFSDAENPFLFYFLKPRNQKLKKLFNVREGSDLQSGTSFIDTTTGLIAPAN